MNEKPKSLEYDPEIAKFQCGQVGCNNLIEDWQDDLGGWYKMTPHGYVPMCRGCYGPPTGDR